MTSKNLESSLLALVARASSDLPADVELAVRRAARRADAGSPEKYALGVMCTNIDLARDNSQPICQDTGTLIFYARLPGAVDPRDFRRAAERAVARATAEGHLRQNSVDTLSGTVAANNRGPGTPVFHIEPWGRRTIDVRLIL
ncbi:MAG: fumarate hydratase, partial [Planctomycetia bacterium]|nr:fumarate hydratase [Planctomycetia bacterium]